MKRRRYQKPRESVLKVRSDNIRDRLFLVVQDEPGDCYKRVCAFCGAEVEGLLVRGKGKGTGQEYVRCLKGHYLTSEDWRIEPND